MNGLAARVIELVLLLGIPAVIAIIRMCRQDECSRLQGLMEDDISRALTSAEAARSNAASKQRLEPLNPHQNAAGRVERRGRFSFRRAIAKTARESG